MHTTQLVSQTLTEQKPDGSAAAVIVLLLVVAWVEDFLVGSVGYEN